MSSSRKGALNVLSYWSNAYKNVRKTDSTHREIINHRSSDHLLLLHFNILQLIPLSVPVWININMQADS